MVAYPVGLQHWLKFCNGLDRETAVYKFIINLVCTSVCYCLIKLPHHSQFIKIRLFLFLPVFLWKSLEFGIVQLSMTGSAWLRDEISVRFTDLQMCRRPS
eukprot:TRINITY_DN2041_c0_g1_i2.p1 TRINITY_DN2041_c0_g1~~TRINITY_DN2041_c0_g1_i2.p1  ORF type:complete len:100 (+),score=6.41 TRINITY_DN2041_c0_g1_i2:40-339(+)